MKTTIRSPLVWFIVVLSSVALIGFFLTPALADETGASEAYESEDSALEIDQFDALDVPLEYAEESFGLNAQATWVSAKEFDPADSGMTWNRGPGGGGSYRCRTAGGTFWFDGPIRLPSGARILTVRVYYDDNSATQNLMFWIFRTTVKSESSVNTPFTITNLTPSFPQSPAGIARYRSMAQNVNIRIANRYNIYEGRARLGGNGVCLTGLRLFWERAVRTGLPNPFIDIGGLNARFQNAIKALSASGITRGTSPNTYSPNRNITRGEMAVFLAEALGLYWDYWSGY